MSVVPEPPLVPKTETAPAAEPGTAGGTVWRSAPTSGQEGSLPSIPVDDGKHFCLTFWFYSGLYVHIRDTTFLIFFEDFLTFSDFILKEKVFFTLL